MDIPRRNFRKLSIEEMAQAAESSAELTPDETNTIQEINEPNDVLDSRIAEKDLPDSISLEEESIDSNISPEVTKAQGDSTVPSLSKEDNKLLSVGLVRKIIKAKNIIDNDGVSIENMSRIMELESNTEEELIISLINESPLRLPSLNTLLEISSFEPTEIPFKVLRLEESMIDSMLALTSSVSKAEQPSLTPKDSIDKAYLVTRNISFISQESLEDIRKVIETIKEIA